MPERVVKVNLVAQVQAYISGMEKAALKTRELGSEAEKLAQKRQAFEDLGRPLLAFGAIAAVAVGIAIRKFADFDQAMSQVNAVTQETTANQQLLRDAALAAGGATVFTAREAAAAEEELAKAGLKTADIIGGALSGSLALAASGQLEVARAGEITAITLKQFALDGSQAGRVADVLSAGANKAVGSVEDLAQGLKFVGPVAHSLGASLEDTTATLAFFADQGIVGEQAGTALRGMLASLQAPSAAAQVALDNLGLSIYDGTGQFIGMRAVVDKLHTSLDGKTQAERDAALGVIFTNQQLTAAQTLVAASADEWQVYRDAVNDSGVAARIAAERMDNLAGDAEKLGGAFDTFLIKGGSAANESLRGMIQTLTFLVDAVGEAPQPLLDAGLAAGTVAAAVALSGGAALVAAPRLVAFKSAAGLMGMTAKGAALATAGVGAALGLATVLIGSFIDAAAQARAVTAEFRDSLDQNTGALTSYSRELIAKKLAENGAFEQAERLGIAQDELTDAILSGGTALDDIKEKTSADFYGSLGFQSVGLTGQIDELANAVVDGQADFKDLKAATASTGDTVDQFSGKVTSANVDLKALKDTIEGFGSAQLDVNSATRAFEAAIDDATASVSENGKTLDSGAEAGRANAAALDEIATSTLKLTTATLEQTGSQEAATATMQRGRDAYIAAAIEAGKTAEEAAALADGLGLIPANVGVSFQISGYDIAMQKLQNLYSQSKNLQHVTHYEGSVLVKGYAGGGYTPSKPTMAWVSEQGREFVSTAATVADPANRAALEYMHGGGSMSSYAPVSNAPQASGNTYITVPVTVAAGLVADAASVSKQIAAAVKTGLRNGDIPADWNSQ